MCRKRRILTSRGTTHEDDVRYCSSFCMRPLWMISKGETSLSLMITAMLFNPSIPLSHWKYKHSGIFYTTVTLKIQVKAKLKGRYQISYRYTLSALIKPVMIATNLQKHWNDFQAIILLKLNICYFNYDKIKHSKYINCRLKHFVTHTSVWICSAAEHNWLSTVKAGWLDLSKSGPKYCWRNRSAG